MTPNVLQIELRTFQQTRLDASIPSSRLLAVGFGPSWHVLPEAVSAACWLGLHALQGVMRRSWWVGLRVAARDSSLLLGFIRILSMLVVAPY